MKITYIRSFYLIIIVLLNFQALDAKISFTTPITLANQAAIDDFATNYPGISSISGDLLIGDFSSACTEIDITSLNGLSQITSIGGNLKIHRTLLTDLSGLDNIQSVNGFMALTSNSSLESINGLGALNSLGGIIIGFDNYSLTDIDAFLNLSTIGGDVAIFSDGFTDLNGLSNITSIEGGLSLGCYGLLNLNALSNLTIIGGDFILNENYSLADIEGLSNLTSINGNLYLNNNHTISNLDGLLNLASINGCIFLNQNDNLNNIGGIANLNPTSINYKDDLDPPGQDIMINNNPQLAFCAVESICTALGLPGTTYSIEGNAPGCLESALNCAGAVCTSLSYPLEGSQNIPVNIGLTWANSINATGYRLSIGTTPSGSEILDSFDVGNSISYQPLNNLPCGTQIYVRVLPYRNNGEAIGCTEQTFFTESVVADASADQDICKGSSVILNSSGGTIYQWSPTSGLNNPNIPNPIANPISTTDYIVSVSNDRGCSDTTQLTVIVDQPPLPNILGIAESGNGFNNGMAMVNPSGGESPYTYLWSNGKTTKTILNLIPGMYSVTVTGANNCFSVDSVSVNEFICPNLIINSHISDNTCFNTCDGSVSILNIENAITPLNYVWNDGSQSDSLNNLCSGSYSILVTDVKNCSVSDSFIVDEPQEIIISVDSIQYLSSAQQGRIEISCNITGTYEWTGPNGYSSTSEDIYDLEAGCYTLIFTDSTSDCNIDTTICISDITSTSYSENLFEINIYPNPASGYFALAYMGSGLSEIKIKVFDLSGREIIIEAKGAETGELFVDTTNFNPGLYLVKIYQNSRINYRKLMIAK